MSIHQNVLPANFNDILSPLESRPRNTRSPSVSSSCTLGREDGSEDSDPDNLFENAVVDLTNYDDSILQGGLLKATENALERFCCSIGYIQAGDFVGVEGICMGDQHIDFVEVKVVARDVNGSVHVRGIPFTRTRNLVGKLPKKRNEVCKILHYHRSHGSDSHCPLTIDVSPTAIVQNRKLVYTNSLWPQHNSARHIPLNAPNRELQVLEQEASGILVCRWKLKVWFEFNGRRARCKEEVLERILFLEVPKAQYRVSDEILCNRWRGGRVLGSSWTPGTACESINVEEADPPLPPRRCVNNQRYTLFDSFSGAGGVSRGAQSAGIRVAYAVDSAPAVWDTYQSNFPSVRLFKMSIDEFIKESNRMLIRVDFLHLSPPCQYFSPAHTRESAADDANIFALFGCNELIRKTKPRIITLEQTFGITHDRHLLYLQALIGDLTQFGYSVRWSIVQLKTWGAAQDRKRLIVLAAAPGEKLPPFPKATHSDDPDDGLKPLVTICQALQGIRAGDDLHDLDDVKYHNPPRPSYNPDRLAMTLTTGCREMYFPDGTRDLTLRELASLQGFPRRHRFKGTRTAIRRQIGNAFPPTSVHTLYKHLREWLENEDEVKTSSSQQTEIVAVDELVAPLLPLPIAHSDSMNYSGLRDMTTHVIDLT